MADATDKIKLEDITFEDMIDEGLKETPVEEPKKEEPTAEADLEDSSIDEDIQEKKEEPKEEPKEEVVEEPKVEAKEEPVEELEDTLVSEIATKFGYDLEGDYEDTPEGLTAMTNEIANKVAESQLDKLFVAYPEVKEHLEYSMNGGDSRQFILGNNAIKDLKDFTITENNINSQQAVMAEYLKVKGHDQDFISEMISDYTDSEKLYDKAVKAKKALVEYHENVKTEQLKKQAEYRKVNEQDQKKFWDGVHETISTGKEFKGITIQEKDKSDFFDFISRPINSQGTTKRDQAYGEADIETRLAIDYLLYSKFDLKSLVTKKAKTKASKDLRSRLKASGNKIKTAGKGVKTSTGTFDVDDLDLDLGNWS
jgi:hypothetical protein